MAGKREHLGPMWTILRKGIDLEDLISFLNHMLLLGCSQREAEVDHEAIQSEYDLFRRNTTTTEVTNDVKMCLL